MKVKTPGGKVFTGTASEIARQMKVEAFVPVDTLPEWLWGAKFRAKNWNNAAIRIDTVEHTIADLIKYEILELVED